MTFPQTIGAPRLAREPSNQNIDAGSVTSRKIMRRREPSLTTEILMDNAAGGVEDLTCKRVNGVDSIWVSTQELVERKNICTKASANAAYGDASVRPQMPRKRNAVAFGATATDAIRRRRPQPARRAAAWASARLAHGFNEQASES